MYSNMEDFSTKYEQKIIELSKQIREYESQIQQYKALLDDKEYHINLLYKENQELKNQIQNIQQPITPPPVYNPPSYTSPSSNQNAQFTPMPIPPTSKIANSPIATPSTPTPATSIPKPISTTMKRQCPNCGAFGFAIREIEDKSQIISYVPRRIYVKIKHCTKCGFEF